MNHDDTIPDRRYIVRTNLHDLDGEREVFHCPVDVDAASFEEAAEKRIRRLLHHPDYDNGRVMVQDGPRGDVRIFTWKRRAVPTITLTPA